MYAPVCQGCGLPAEIDLQNMACRACGQAIGFTYDPESLRRREDSRSMWRYAGALPIAPGTEPVSLGEGFTPLLRCQQEWAGGQVWLKDETRNPTGSMKDRALSVAFTKGKELGATRAIMASTGSAGISGAAFAARAGIPITVLVPKGTPRERLIAMTMLGAELIEVDGTIEDCLNLLHTARNEYGWYETSTLRKANPFTGEGPKTISFEIVEQLGRVPDVMVVPVGGGGTLSGIWHGFEELQASGLTDRLPRIIAVQGALFNRLGDRPSGEVQHGGGATGNPPRW
jgi:threonine synthase